MAVAILRPTHQFEPRHERGSVMRLLRSSSGPTEAEVRAALIAVARSDLRTFIEMLHKEVAADAFVWEAWHDRWADLFGRITRYEVQRATFRTRPRYGKTELNLMWMAHCVGRVPSSNWIWCSYSSDLSETASGKLQRYVESETFRSVFPGVSIDRNTSSRARWLTNHGGQILAVGLEGQLTGHAAGRYRSDVNDRRFMGCVILDDPLKIGEARSKVERDRVWNFFTEVLRSRRNTPDTALLVTGQRAHADDLFGRLDASGEPWENLIVPWIDEQGRSTSVRFPAEDAKLIRDMSPLIFATQYLQRPYLEEGALFEPDRMPVVDVAPAGLARRVRGWDLGATVDGDWTAGVRLAKFGDGRFVIENVVRLRWRPDQVRAAILATAKRDGSSVRISIPQDPGQAGKSQVQDLTAMLAGFTVIATPESGDKTTRAEPAAAQCNVGNVSVVRGPWNDALFQELRGFPAGMWDDQTDALSRAFAALIGRPAMQISAEALELFGRRFG